MADVGRCGRRKQRNPQRKNDCFSKMTIGRQPIVYEEGVDFFLALALKAKAESGVDGVKESCCTPLETSTMCQNGGTNGCHDDSKTASDMAEESSVEIDDQEMPSPSDIQTKAQSQENTTTSDANERDVTSEEENISELLNRTDTAVIFPEPTSDQEDSVSGLTEEDEHDKEMVNGVCVFKCPHCEHGFQRLFLLRDHIKQSHPELVRRFMCPKCSAGFTLKSQLDKHLALHSPTCQSCGVCRKTFANVYRLQRHMISHNESSDLRKFKCMECGKAFKFKHHLKEHVRIHSGEKPFECPNCGKRFSHSGSFSSHMTSKKCFVMAAKKPAGEKSSLEHNITRELATSYASTFPDYAAQYIPFSTAAQISARVAQFNGMRPPFLPYLPFSMANAMFPNFSGLHGLTKPDDATATIRDKLDCKMSPKKSPSVQPTSPNPLKSESPTKHVKKVLEIAGATVSKQERLSAEKDKVGLSKLTSPTNGKMPEVKSEMTSPSPDSSLIKEEMPVANSVKMESSNEERMYCRFCYESFKSPVELHQHERYLCKKSAEVMHKGSDSTEQKSECSTQTSTPMTSDDDDDNDKEQNGRCRSRSLFNEEQLAILKTYYQSNPRPRKIELLTLANKVGYPKRVVQVWFQNMRARDRRHGKNLLYFSNMAAQQLTQPSDRTANGGIANSVAKQGSYIPVVPQPYVPQSIPQGMVYYATQHHQFSPDTTLPMAPFQQPAPEQMQPLDLSKKTGPPEIGEHLALNLSQKSVSSRIHEQLQDMKRFQDSAIFKYMRQEGMFVRSNTSSPQSNNESTPPRQFAGLTNGHDTVKLLDRKFHENNPITHRRSYSNSPAPSGGESDATMEEDPFELKLRRQRKKSWKQMESEEAELEFIDSPLTSDDQPMKKKRKSWKQHRVDIDEGMYACDQCDKMFSKQSSLARHKYEHSGARPFNCDICLKAFKHKHHLTEHRRLHSGEKPFECKKCGKRFSHSGSYSQHMNHRYKYCKPMKAALEAGEEIGDSE